MKHRGCLRVTVLGIRGIPNVQGGVETHAEHLYKRLSDLGCEVEVIVRSPFVPRDVRSFGSVRLRRIWSPRTPGIEALVHSFLGVMYAGLIRRPHILHIHAIGPSIVTPIARLLGLRVVITHHGPDYDRDKWRGFARWILRTGERMGVNFSHARIAISKVIADLVQSKYGGVCDLIPNGVESVSVLPGTDSLDRFGLKPRRYFLQVSRIVPEKRQLDLIEAYKSLSGPDWKLVLVGGLDSNSYSERVEEMAREAGVVLTGFLTGVPLAQIYAHAGAFVLPSSHEGLPIALLEALSYGLPVLASDIPANLEVGLDQSSYFRLGDTTALSGELLRLQIERSAEDEVARANRMEWVARAYDWDRIAEQTVAVYRRLCS